MNIEDGDAALACCLKGQTRLGELPVPGLPGASKPWAALAWPYQALSLPPSCPLLLQPHPHRADKGIL